MADRANDRLTPIDHSDGFDGEKERDVGPLSPAAGGSSISLRRSATAANGGRPAPDIDDGGRPAPDIDDGGRLAPDALPLRPILAFGGAAYERDFVHFYNSFYYRYAQASLTVGLLLIGADFVADYLFDPSLTTNFYRLQVCLPILGTGICLSFTPFARRHWQPIMAGFIALVAFSLFAVLLAIDHQGGMGLKSWVGILNFTFLEFYCLVILGVRFNVAFMAGALILIGFEAAMYSELTDHRATFFYLTYQVATTFVLPAGIGWWREYVLRKDFSTQTTLQTARDFLEHQNVLLEAEVKRRTHELLASQDAAILTIAALVETRDNETGNHVRRTQHYVRALARQLQTHPTFAGYLTDHQIDILFKSAPLHDIGKIGIPDSILHKPGRLSGEEMEIMKTHTSLGAHAIREAEHQLGMKVSFLACVHEIALSHHEKWDGTGYPRQLARNDIPISARLMALADVYDALISRRVYKPAMSHAEASLIIIGGRGSQFDPDVVDAFVAVQDTFRHIAEHYADGDPAMTPAKTGDSVLCNA
ncbi:MAG TPA: HD domain-containing phosphohydrolase [Acetobacteraceae bacterium]|nr:HD domain-containing phosphohydrolase [Acetobacteraceae bacterium]